MLVVWLVCPSAPGPHSNPLPSNGRGGMFVVDEGVAAVMGGWWFGWRAPPSPGIPRSVVGPLGFACSRPFRGAGAWWWFGW